jgi:hypothetical protein
MENSIINFRLAENEKKKDLLFYEAFIKYFRDNNVEVNEKSVKG